MRTSFVYGIFIISLIGSFSSCQSEKTQKILAEIEQMQISVDSSDNIYRSMDTATIFSYKKNAETQIEYLEKFYHDTVFENAKYIDVYYGNFKLLRKLTRSYGRLGEEIEFSKSQLSRLHNDVKNGFAADSSYIKFVSDEHLAVTKIVNTTATFVKWEKKGVQRYERMIVSIDSIVIEMKNQGYRE